MDVHIYTTFSEEDLQVKQGVPGPQQEVKSPHVAGTPPLLPRQAAQLRSSVLGFGVRLPGLRPRQRCFLSV